MPVLHIETCPAVAVNTNRKVTSDAVSAIKHQSYRQLTSRLQPPMQPACQQQMDTRWVTMTCCRRSNMQADTPLHYCQLLGPRGRRHVGFNKIPNQTLLQYQSCIPGLTLMPYLCTWWWQHLQPAHQCCRHHLHHINHFKHTLQPKPSNSVHTYVYTELRPAVQLDAGPKRYTCTCCAVTTGEGPSSCCSCC